MRQSTLATLALSAAVLFGLIGCTGTPSHPAAAATAAAPAAKAAPPKVTVTDASFSCIRDLKPVRGFYVGNVLGKIDATLKVAQSSTGGVYPAGSVIQLVPTEAMVKHEAGYSPATKDWEFFELEVAPKTTKIHVRGAADVVNRFGGNCLSCHAQAAPQWDMVCESTHGCAPIPITPVMAKAIQNTDPRCPPIADLPPDQVAALKALAAMMAAAQKAAAPK